MFKKWRKKKSKIIELKKFEIVGQQNPLSVCKIEGPLSDAFISCISNFKTENTSTGAISKKAMLGLIGTNSTATALSIKAGSGLYVATANTASLMKIGGGLGTAVVKGGTIVGQAPFVAAGGAVATVALPLVAAVTVSTVVVLKQFEKVNKKLDTLDKNIKKIIQRDEAEFAGKILYAERKLTHIEQQYNVSKRFSPEMKSSLSNLEQNIGESLERYRILYESESLSKDSKQEDLKQKHHDSYYLIALTILELRIEQLRIKMALEEAPEQLELLTESFYKKADGYQKIWDKIQSDPKKTKGIASDLQELIEEMNIWQKHMPSWLGGKRSQRKTFEKIANEFTEHSIEIDGAVDDLVKSGIKISEKPLNSHQVTLIYWVDQNGDEHSLYATEDELEKIVG